MVMRGMILAAGGGMPLVKAGGRPLTEVGAAPASMVCSQRRWMRSLLLEWIVNKQKGTE